MSRLLSFTTVTSVAAAILLGTAPASSHAQHDHPHAKPAHADSTRKPAKPVPADTAKADTVYTCPMDPDVVSKTPARCPKCGMKLVKKAVTKQAPKDSTHPHKGATHSHTATPAKQTANDSGTSAAKAHTTCCHDCRGTCNGCDDCSECCDNGSCNDCGSCAPSSNSTP